MRPPNRKCRRCNKRVPADRFRSNHAQICNACIAKEKGRATVEEHPTVRRSRHLRYRYGISDYAFARLLANQDDACGICHRSLVHGYDEPICVDHDHVSGAVRGLLCRRCNLTVLPAVLDNWHIAASAADYLANPPASAHLSAIALAEAMM